MRKCIKIFVLLLVIVILITVPVFPRENIKFHQNKWTNSTKSIGEMQYAEDNNQEISFTFFDNDENLLICLSTSTGEIIYVEQVDKENNKTFSTLLNEPLLSRDYVLSITNGLNEYYREFSID